MERAGRFSYVPDLNSTRFRKTGISSFCEFEYLNNRRVVIGAEHEICSRLNITYMHCTILETKQNSPVGTGLSDASVRILKVITFEWWFAIFGIAKPVPSRAYSYYSMLQVSRSIFVTSYATGRP